MGVASCPTEERRPTVSAEPTERRVLSEEAFEQHTHDLPPDDRWALEKHDEALRAQVEALTADRDAARRGEAEAAADHREMRAQAESWVNECQTARMQRDDAERERDRHRQRRLVLQGRLRTARVVRDAFIGAAKDIGESKLRQVAHWKAAFLSLAEKRPPFDDSAGGE